VLGVLADFLQAADADQQVIGFDKLVSGCRRFPGSELPGGGRSKR